MNKSLLFTVSLLTASQFLPTNVRAAAIDQAPAAPTVAQTYGTWSQATAGAYRAYLRAEYRRLTGIGEQARAAGHPHLAPPASLLKFHADVYDMVTAWIQADEQGTLSPDQRATYTYAVTSVESSTELYLAALERYLADSTPYNAPHEPSVAQSIAKGVLIFTGALRESQAASRVDTVHVRVTQ